MNQLLRRASTAALASAVSLSLLSGVASLADGDRQVLAQAKVGHTTLVTARTDGSRR